MEIGTVVGDGISICTSCGKVTVSGVRGHL
jgi:hypothetical protein